jgi:hypothetical protein
MLKMGMWNWVWWYMPVIQALRRLRQEDQEFKANVAYQLMGFSKCVYKPHLVGCLENYFFSINLEAIQIYRG